ncbi:MAG: HAMP domain-containing protein, partial [Cyanobacteria bacterium J06648_11]
EARELLGITNVDITVSDLVAQLGDAGVVEGTNDDYFAVLSGEGNIITFPPNQPPAPLEGEPGSSFEFDDNLASIWPEIERAVANSPEGLLSIAGRFWAYQKMPSTGWVALASVPTGTVRNPVIVNSLGALGLAALFLGAAVALFVRNLNKRLNPILAECNKLAATDATTRSRLVGQDEIGRLSTSFFNLLAQVDANERKILEEVDRTKQAQQQLQQQARQVEAESEMLQDDVGHLLDVVSAAEDGDLTVKADVSERATGLVADTFNRLVEQLSTVIAVVNSSAQQTAGGASELENIAVSAAEQANRQAQSLVEVEALMEGVTTLAGDTAQQARLTDESVQQARSAVVRGQAEMQALTQSTDVLRQGTDQIVKRSQTLNNFVELAAQFAKDQKRTAALTRVLALNASMLAARAKGQSDPDQFASIANEFETVASQVNDLATSTNQGLMVLQQRTDQIQTVVSGLNQDVNDIDQQVQSITTGVAQSSQVFDNIQTATTQVEATGQQTLSTSQSIAQSAQTTLQSVRGLSAIASDTSDRAALTRQRSSVMEQLSRNLLQNVEFFRLPEQPADDDSAELTDRDSLAPTLPSIDADVSEADVSANGHRPAAVGQASDL